uniref:C2H2-type domain-containing protein n=1 Tax=Timema douglasi TaxID=61478 RepID=A0A7R8Z9J2_TIMDO|nr:unnamed protein product [Timema douglasi]
MAGNPSKPRGDEDVVCVPEIDIKQEDESVVTMLVDKERGSGPVAIRPVVCLVYCESITLDHVDTEAGHVKKQINDISSTMSAIDGRAAIELNTTSALANYTTEAGILHNSDDLDEEQNSLRIYITEEEDLTDLIKSEPSMSEPSADEKDAEAYREGPRRCRRRHRRKKCTLTEDQPDQLPDPIIRSRRKRTVRLVKPYSCDLCVASFKTRKELKAHEVEHFDERFSDLKEPKPRPCKKKKTFKALTRKLKYYPTFCGKYLTNCRADSRQVSKRRVANNTKIKSISENSSTVDETIESVISDFNLSVVSGTKQTEQVKSWVRSKRVSSVSDNFDIRVESGTEKAQQVETPLRIKRKIVPNRKYASEWYTTDSDFDFDCLVKRGSIEPALGEITSNMMAISVIITPDDVHKTESVVNNMENWTPKVITKPLTMAHNKHRKQDSAKRERDSNPKIKIPGLNQKKDVIRTRPRTKNVYRVRPRANDVSPALFPSIPLEKTLVAPASAAVKGKPINVCDMVLEIPVKNTCQMQTHSIEMINSEDAYRIVLKGRGEQNEENNKDQVQLPVVRRNMKTGEEVTVARISILESTAITEDATSENHRHHPCATDNVAWNSTPDVDGKPVRKRKKKKSKEFNYSEMGNESVEIGTTKQRSLNDSTNFESDINENTVIRDDHVRECNTTDLERLNMSLCNLNILNQSPILKKEGSPLYEATQSDKIGRKLANAKTKSKGRKHKKAQSPSVSHVDSTFISKSVTNHVFETGMNENCTSSKNEVEQTLTSYESTDMSLTSQSDFNQPTIPNSELLPSYKRTGEPAPLNSEARKNSLADNEEIKPRKRKRKRVHSKKSKRLHGLSLAETISLLSKETVDPENLIKSQELSPRASDHKHIRFSDSTRDEEKENNIEASLESSDMTHMQICTSLTSNNIASAAKSSRLINKSHNLVSNLEEPLDQSNMSLCTEKGFFTVNSGSVSPKPLYRARSLPSGNHLEPEVPARLGGNLESKWDITYPAPTRPTNQGTETFGNLLSLRHNSTPCVFKRKQPKRESAQNDGTKTVSPGDQPQETVSSNQEATVQPMPENSHISEDESNLPVFTGVPKKNDHFIFKKLVLTEACIPRLSADITAIVQEYFPSTSEVELKILSGHEQLQQSVKKFSIVDEEIEPCDIILLNWNEMIEPKRIN